MIPCLFSLLNTVVLFILPVASRHVNLKHLMLGYTQLSSASPHSPNLFYTTITYWMWTQGPPTCKSKYVNPVQAEEDNVACAQKWKTHETTR